MNWTQNVAQWRKLTHEAKLLRRWEMIPANVAGSMAFEGEPVPVEHIRKTLESITTAGTFRIGRVVRFRKTEVAAALEGMRIG